MSTPLTDQLRLSPDDLRWQCDPDSLGMEITSDIEPCEDIIGQDRAIRAIRTGLNIKSHGYNLFVSGLTGTGKTTTIRKLLEQMNGHTQAPDDICFVHNFLTPDSPRYLTFPAGGGKAFARAMDQTLRSLRKHLPEIYERDDYKQRQKDILDQFRGAVQQAIHTFEKEVQAAGMTLVQIQSDEATRPEIYPVIGEETLPWQKLAEQVAQGKFKKEDFERLRGLHDEFMDTLQELASHQQEQEKETHDVIEKLDREVARPTVQAQIARLKEKFPDAAVGHYLTEVAEDILEQLDRFRGENEAPPQGRVLLPQAAAHAEESFLNYQVNVVVDNARTQGTPIIIEKIPNYVNLFGTIERVWDPSGQWRTNFTKIKAGSLLRANGGYLVFNLLDAAAENGVWTTLKRTLKNKQLAIQNPETMSSFSSNALSPQPIDINLKVVVIGDENTYRALYHSDDEFKKIFKIRADFDTVMPNEAESIQQYTGFVRKITQDEALLPVDKTGMAAILEHSVWLAGHRGKLSARFSDMADVIREAHFWAAEGQCKAITAKQIDRAVEERIYRVGMLQEKIYEMIDEGTVLLDVAGEAVGQVNGLSVLSLGDHAFGQPSRITAEVAVGRAGIINIEREAGLSGPSHNKGVLILTGYLRRMYAQNKPLTLSASLCFEQNYSGVDGDSASSTEIYALLSALSTVPLRQDIAVTGSVNQKGEIQPIGGINHKIEGFFDICRTKGLTGTQGVLMPRTNLNDLMLRRDVIQSVESGQFHIWAVETIDEGIEILTGLAAGTADAAGRFPQESIHGRADAKLSHFAQVMRDYLKS